jgi:hypothetical protein
MRCTFSVNVKTKDSVFARMRTVAKAAKIQKKLGFDP